MCELVNFSTGVIKQRDQGNLRKRRVYLGLPVSEMGVHYHLDGEHGHRQVSMALAVVESSYPDPHTMKHTLNGWSLFETSKPTANDIPPPKPHLFPKQYLQLESKYSNTSQWGGHSQSDGHNVPDEVLLCRRNSLVKQKCPHFLQAHPTLSMSWAGTSPGLKSWPSLLLLDGRG